MRRDSVQVGKGVFLSLLHLFLSCLCPILFSTYNPRTFQQPSKQPSNNPTPTTALPTTKSPTRSPIPSSQVIACPSIGSKLTLIAGSSVLLGFSSSNALCAIYVESGSSLIPFARSYNTGKWEAAPGPFASPSSGILCSASECGIHLPLLSAGDSSYVLLAKDGTMTNRNQVAAFLMKTTFGPKREEINALDNANWGDAARAQYIRNQMDMNATSHREYYRKRANTKWDATAQPARSDHPCSPNSKWRKYAFINQDRQNTIDNSNIYTTFEVVPSEASLVSTIYEADVAGQITCKECSFKGALTTSNTGYSSTGYYDIGECDVYT